MFEQTAYVSRRQTPAPPPGALAANYKNKPFGYSCLRSSGTKDWLLMYTMSGEGCVREDDHRQFCRAGDLIILPPGTPHDYFTTEGNRWEMMWVHFIPRPTWASWLRLPKVSRGLLFIHIGDTVTRSRICAAFHNLITDIRSITNPFRLELGLGSLEMILLLAASQNSRTSAHTLDPRIEEVLKLISDNVSKSYSVKELAEKVRLSPSRLAHLFKEQTGDSILETALKLRLREAAKLLEFTSRDIREIAAEVGFLTPEYFTRQFTRYYGVNPSCYRKDARHTRINHS